MQKPEYSIIIPVYNCHEYLPGCIESVLAQTYQNFEIILVDDGSADSSAKLCDDFVIEHSCVRAFHKSNGGAASARNIGIQNAQGAYIVFIDADDTIASACLETVDAIIAEFRPNIVIYGMAFDYYRKDSLERTEIMTYPHDGLMASVEFLKKFNELFIHNSLSSACNKVFDAEIIRKNELLFREGMTLYEDFEFVLRYLAYAQNVYCISKAFYHYRITDGEDHLQQRLKDLTKTKSNLDTLAWTLRGLKVDGLDPDGTAGLIRGLYLQMLYRHLLKNDFSTSQLSELTASYCSGDSYQWALNASGQPAINECRMLMMIQNASFVKLKFWLFQRRVRYKTRNLLKRAFISLGLRRK